jgi:hypothetical protein
MKSHDRYVLFNTGITPINGVSLNILVSAGGVTHDTEKEDLISKPNSCRFGSPNLGLLT